MTSLPKNPGATRLLVTLEEMEAAATRIRDVVVRTPLLPLPALSEVRGRKVAAGLSGGNLDPSLMAALGTAAV